MRRTIATTVLFATTPLVMAQAQFEIGLQFNDHPEIVRVEPTPFSMSADSEFLPYPFHQRAVALNLFDDSEPSLSGINIHVRAVGAGDSALFSRARTVAAFDDLVFTATESKAIMVNMEFVFPSLVFVVPSGEEYEGIKYTSKITVEIDGQPYRGSSTVILTGDSERFEVEFSGILVHRAGGVVSIRDIEVPTNKPVTLRIEIAKSIDRPEGVSGQEMLIRLRSPESGFPIARDIFTLPDGVRVDSVQARISNNRWLICPADINQDGGVDIFDFLELQNLFDAGDPLADFDRDGALTIFDFLAFQNAFDAGCP
ncbi:MAG: hypothetical protein NCW75_13660 [Phycisphaera sp.]|nr:MAG: hypothetical protein NCW75_13660 [Phycisphaera sp.]